MKILMTGATGFIGSHLKVALEDEGHEVRTVKTKNLCYGEESKAIIEYKEISDFDFDTVIHLGGLSTADNNGLHYELNVESTNTLLRYINFRGIIPRFIYASTINVYGPWYGECFCTTDLPEPETFYAYTKLMAEQLVNSYTDMKKIYGINMRLCPIVGKGMTHGVFNDIMNSVLDPAIDTITLRSAPLSVYRPFLFIKDFCDVVITYLNTEKLGIVNVGPNDCISLERVVEIIGNVSGIYKPIKYQATGEKFSKMRIADSVITRHSSNSISRAVEQILEKE